MKKTMNLIISIKRNKTKIVLFYVDIYEKIIIHEVIIINKSILKSKSIYIKIYKKYDITQTLIVISKKVFKNINKYQSTLNKLGIDTTLMIHKYFLISYILKNNKQRLDISIKEIQNGWINLSLIDNIDLNAAIYYLVNLEIKQRKITAMSIKDENNKNIISNDSTVKMIQNIKNIILLKNDIFSTYCFEESVENEIHKKLDLLISIITTIHNNSRENKIVYRTTNILIDTINMPFDYSTFKLTFEQIKAIIYVSKIQNQDDELLKNIITNITNLEIVFILYFKDI